MKKTETINKPEPMCVAFSGSFVCDLRLLIREWESTGNVVHSPMREKETDLLVLGDNEKSKVNKSALRAEVLTIPVMYEKQFMKQYNPYRDTYSSDIYLADEIKEGSRPTTVDETIDERGERYGKFSDGAEIMQTLKNTMRDTPNWQGLTCSQRESLEMIQHKIGRILNGDPKYDDNWRDICGYSQLVLDELNGLKR